MVRIVRTEASTQTEVTGPEFETVPVDQTHAPRELPRRSVATQDSFPIGPSLYEVTESGTEAKAEEPKAVPVLGLAEDEDATKNRRAKANALMDLECVRFLGLFTRNGHISVDELARHIKQTKDWLKIVLLVRADYLETLDSMVRITPEGRTAWADLHQFGKPSDSEG